MLHTYNNSFFVLLESGASGYRYYIGKDSRNKSDAIETGSIPRYPTPNKGLVFIDTDEYMEGEDGKVTFYICFEHLDEDSEWKAFHLY